MNWEKEFDKKFSYIYEYPDQSVIDFDYEDLKKFIQSLLEEVIKDIPNKRSDLGQGFGSIREDLALLKHKLRDKYLTK